MIWNDLATPIWAKRCCGSPVTSRPSNSTRAAGWRKGAGQQIEIGALAGAVGTDDRGDRALGEFRRNIVQRDEFAEQLADAPGAQDDLPRLARRPRSWLEPLNQRPPDAGRKEQHAEHEDRRRRRAASARSRAKPDSRAAETRPRRSSGRKTFPCRRAARSSPRCPTCRNAGFRSARSTDAAPAARRPARRTRRTG